MEKPDGPELSNGRENFGSEFGVTPNANCASVNGARPLIGMFSIWRELITCPVDAVAVSSIEPSADTVTDWSTVPTSRRMSRCSRSFVVTRTCWLTYFLNPGASAVTVYGPGGRNGSTYVPSVFVTVWNFAPVSFSVAKILAFGIEDSWGSVTCPLNVPRNSCAGDKAGSKNAHMQSATLRKN